MEKLDREVNCLQSGWCCDLMNCFVMVLFPCCCFAPLYCNRVEKFVRDWDKALRNRQDRFNELILERIGVFVKTQSFCFITRGEDGQEKRNYSRWLAFSLIPTDIEALKKEPHLTGYTTDGTCCSLDERDMCMHP